MKRLKGCIFGTLVALAVFAIIYVYVHPVITPADELPVYHVSKHLDDTLRVALIGDSWVMFHYTLGRDSVLQYLLQSKVPIPVKVHSRGKGGANSKEVYYYMFSSETIESEQEPDYCTQPLLEEHPNYCIISAGINDVGQGRGADFYCQNYQNILHLLLCNKIRPVVLELPTVTIDNRIEVHVEDFFNENRSFAVSRIKKRLGFWVTAQLTGADMYHVDECRTALRRMLDETGLIDSVVYIGIKEWNPEGYKDRRGIYLNDGTHLNLAGYDVLDSCFAEAIRKDYAKRLR